MSSDFDAPCASGFDGMIHDGFDGFGCGRREYLIISGVAQSWDGSAYTDNQTLWIIPRDALPDRNDEDFDDYAVLPEYDGTIYTYAVAGANSQGVVIGSGLDNLMLVPYAQLPDGSGPIVSPTWKPTPTWHLDVEAEALGLYGYTLYGNHEYSRILSNAASSSIQAFTKGAWRSGFTVVQQQNRVTANGAGEWSSLLDGIPVGLTTSNYTQTGSATHRPRGTTVADWSIRPGYIGSSSKAYLSPSLDDGYHFLNPGLTTVELRDLAGSAAVACLNDDATKAHTVSSHQYDLDSDNNERDEDADVAYREFSLPTPTSPLTDYVEDTGAEIILDTFDNTLGQGYYTQGPQKLFVGSDGDLRLFAVYQIHGGYVFDTTLHLKAVIINIDTNTLEDSETIGSFSISGKPYAGLSFNCFDFDRGGRAYFTFKIPHAAVTGGTAGPTAAVRCYCIDMATLTTVWSKDFGNVTNAAASAISISVSF